MISNIVSSTIQGKSAMVINQARKCSLKIQTVPSYIGVLV
jgi:hypothetical protein